MHELKVITEYMITCLIASFSTRSSIIEELEFLVEINFILCLGELFFDRAEGSLANYRSLCPETHNTRHIGAFPYTTKNMKK